MQRIYNLTINFTVCILLSLFPVSFVSGNTDLSPSISDWAKFGTIGGFDASPGMTDQAVIDLMSLRQTENVSIIEVDSGLSNYLSDTQFQNQVTFLDRVGTLAQQRNLRSVVYFPAMEVTTPNGETLPNTMYKDHPDWIQHGINGSPNVFYGSQEVWVEPGMESAWMSPNTGYKDYFINRIRQLAATSLDGVWIDVPIYLGTGASWAGAEPAAAAAFKSWTISKGLGGANGFQVPSVIDWNSPAFRTWIQWRHENLADFINDVRIAAQAVNPNFMVIIENFPTDYMDATEAGLDGTYRRSNQNFLRVWEIDSVSNTKAMEWATIDEFSNKITMYKWARGVDRENPSWAFSYGYKPLDAGLTMAAAISTGVVPFESQTPDMTKSVNSAFRSQWFGFVQQNQQALLGTPRKANVGIWYSSATRDYQDTAPGTGGYGMYTSTANPNNDPNWWASAPGDSAIIKPHLGGYRGASQALIKLHIPFKIVADPGSPVTELEDLKFLWLPSVAAISNESALLIKNFVTNGGTVFASGKMPGTLDERGNSRATSILKDLFNFTGASSPSTNLYGNGVAIFNPSVRGADMFKSLSNPVKADKDLSTVEQMIRIHAPDDLIVNAPKGIHVEIGQASDSQHFLYVMNYSGLQQPLVSSPKDISIDYHAPAGFRVSSATVSSPDTTTQTGTITVNKVADSYYRMSLNVNQFSLISLTLVPETTPNPEPLPTPNWHTANRQEAAESGLNFILNKMRHSNAPVPMKYGIYTNLINDTGLTEIYAHGHHVTGEHMGLMLRASSCMGNVSAYQQSYQFVNELMADPVYNVVNWAIDRDRHKPLIELSGNWVNSNAPLDDFRVIRGLLQGDSMGTPDSIELAKNLLTGMYWTSVTDRAHKTQLEFPAYPEGLIGYAWDWSGTTDSTLTPPSLATGLGTLSTDPIPTDYNDLFMLGQGAKFNPRWISVLASATDLLLDSEVTGVPGLFYNGYQANGVWTGDFENRETNQGRHLKTIQTLWIALHLAQASEFGQDILNSTQSISAGAAAERSLDFFKNYYLTNNRIPEHFTFSGNDVPLCTSPNVPNGCLIADDEHLVNGEARIYALLARLALILGDSGFASILIDDKILTDRISNINDPRYGLIGVSTTTAGNAEAWNVLESVLTLCLEATSGNTPPAQAPIASNQTLSLVQGSSVPVTLTATDPNQDSLTYQIVSQPSSGSLSGTLPNLVYTPNSGYSGVDSFTFKANDGVLDSNIGTINLTITPVTGSNTAPVANSQSVSTNENTAINIVLSASDQENNVLTYSIVNNPTHGILTGSTPNLIYTPNNGYKGSDSFTFRANDGLLNSNTASVNITVQASSGSVISNLSNTISVDGNMTDWNGLQTFGIDPNDVSGANNKLDWIEGAMAHNAQNVYIIYRNDEPINIDSWWAWQIYIDADNNPNTGYQLGSIGAEYHIEANIIRNYTGNGNSWSWQDVGTAVSSVNGNNVEMSIPRAWLGNTSSLSLAFYGENIAFSGGTTEDLYPDGLFDTQAVVRKFEYSFQTTNQAQAPVAVDQTISLLQDSSKSVTLTASDANQDPLTYRINSQPQSGVLSGTAPNLVYTPNLGYTGSDSFTFRANDGLLDSNIGTINLTITPVTGSNTAPVANSQSVSTNENTAINIVLSASDQENNVLTYSIVNNPAHGILTGSTPNLVYTPNNGYKGSDSFTFRANDGLLNSNTASVNITVQASSGSVISNLSNTISVDGNMTDWNGLQTFGIDPNDVSGANNKLDWIEGAMAHNAQNVYIIYRNDEPINIDSWWAWQIYIDADNNPNTGYQLGSIGAEYHIEANIIRSYTGNGDSWSWQDVGTAVSSVNGNNVEMSIPRAWLGSTSSLSLAFYGENIAFSGGTTEDLYPDGLFDTQAVVRKFEYSFQTTNQAQAPVAIDQTISLLQDSSKSVTLAASDANQDPLTYRINSQPQSGALSGTAPNLVYTPNLGYTGSDSFTFIANDGQLDSNIAVVNVDIQPVNGNTVISNPVTSLVMDGSLSDWNGLVSFGLDPNDVSGAANKLDWLEGWTAHNSDKIYFAYRNQGSIEIDSWWAWQIYIDADNNPNTGYQLGSIGAEYSIETDTVRRYTGNGFSWAWQDVGQASAKVNGDIVELSISRSWFGNINDFRLVFYGQNVAFPGGTTADYYPDGIYDIQAPVRYFEYSLQ